jgi:hypothetical protein
MSVALQSGPGGRFSRTPAADCRRISTSRIKPTHHDDPMVPYTLVLEPGLCVYKIWIGYWSFAHPTVEELRHDLRRGPAVPPAGISGPLSSEQPGRKRQGELLPYRRTQAQVFAEQD